MSTLEVIVRDLRRSSVRSSGVRHLHHALLGAAAWFGAVVVVGRFFPLEQTLSIATWGVPAVFAVAAVAWIVDRPSSLRLMRTADLRLGLKERLSTAWERRLEHGALDELLRRDAVDAAARATLTRAFPPTFRRGEALLTVAVALATAALLALPNPMDQVVAQRKADHAAQAKAASTIAATQKKVAASPSPAQVDPQVQKILADTKAKIASAQDPRTALQAITPAEQQLLQLSDPQTPARASSAQNLANNLASTQVGQPAGRALNASPAQGAQALRSLAAQLPAMSAKDRAELAKALAAAAQQASDPQMAASLQQASAALSKGDIAAATLALNDVASQLDSLQQQESNDQEIAAAINGLEAARQQLADQADRDAGRSTATASGSPSAGASGASNGSGTGSGNANGTGSGTGNGSGSGNGNGGTGGRGSSGSGSGQGTSAQGTERVYVPAQPAPGQSETDPAPLGPGQDVPLTPYTQVIQSYQQTALDAADQSLIPGSERDLVREYFASLGEGSGGS
jgi:hypothetical protein